MHFELGDGGGHSGWEEAEQRHRDQPTYEERNDWAVALLHLGQTRQAVEVFERLEKEQPGRYQTAANLGTAYQVLWPVLLATLGLMALLLALGKLWRWNQ